MMRISSRRASALTFGAFIVTLSLSREAPRAQDLGSSVSLRPGQEVTFSVAVADGGSRRDRRVLRDRGPRNQETGRSR